MATISAGRKSDAALPPPVRRLVLGLMDSLQQGGQLCSPVYHPLHPMYYSDGAAGQPDCIRALLEARGEASVCGILSRWGKRELLVRAEFIAEVKKELRITMPDAAVNALFGEYNPSQSRHTHKRKPLVEVTFDPTLVSSSSPNTLVSHRCEAQSHGEEEQEAKGRCGARACCGSAAHRWEERERVTHFPSCSCGGRWCCKRWRHPRA